MHQQRKNKSKYYNLSKHEHCAIEHMSNDDDLLIKRAGMGRAVVIWEKDKYLEGANRQPKDPLYNTVQF